MKILLVDDDENFRKAMKRLLKSCNYDVVSDNDGKSVLNILMNEHKALDEDENIKLVITDLIMKEMNGDELAHKIKALDRELPVILWSGDPDKIINNPHADYKLDKSIGILELINIIESIKNRKL